MKDKAMKIKINAIIDFFDVHTGEIKATEKVHNTVVDDGLNRIADLIAGVSSTPFRYIGIGTDPTGVTTGDTALGIEATRSTILTPSDEGVGVILYDHIFSFGSGESYSIVEAGLFDSAVESGSTMFNRLTFAAHDVDIDNGVRIRITVTIARP